MRTLIFMASLITQLLFHLESSMAKPFPASDEAPEGMQTLISEDDREGLAYIPDITYAEYSSGPLVLHLMSAGLKMTPSGFEPVGTARPWVLYVPGSAWFPQNLARSVPNMIDFARDSGLAVAIVAYRPSTIEKAPAQLIDIKHALRFLRANANEYNLDPERVAIWGTSSGGHLASLLGLTDGIDAFVNDQFSEQSSAVNAVINFFGPTDFLKMGDFPSIIDHNDAQSPESWVVGGPIQDPAFREKVIEYNPITYVDPERKAPPFLIMHGDRDALVPFNQSVLLFEALRDAGQTVAFYKLKDAGHGDRFFTQQTLTLVRAFLGEHLK